METIDIIRSIGQSFLALADQLEKKNPTAESTAPPTTTLASEDEGAITEKDVRTMLTELSRSGHTQEMKALLAKYGAAKISEVDPKDYRALLEDAKGVKNA